MPNDQLPRATGIDERGRAITRFPTAEGAPQFFARILVERDRNAARSADETDELVAIQQRMSRESPGGRACAVVLLVIVRPQHVALLRIQAEQVSLRAERVYFATTHQGSGPWTRGVAHRIRAFIGVFPDQIAIRLIETEHAFVSRDLAPRLDSARYLSRHARITIHEVDAPVRHRGSGIAGI